MSPREVEARTETSRLRPIVLETLGDFLCEAAVLVAVFGILDKVVGNDDLTFGWTGKLAGCATLLLVFGMACRFAARAQ